MENVETKSTSAEARRSFLKKAAYAAPAVMVLGSLTAPMSAQASIIHHQQTIFNKAGTSAEVTENYDNVGDFTVDGTFTPNGSGTTAYGRQQIASAPKNWLQNFFDTVFGRV
jgi:hypothetical protein